MMNFNNYKQEIFSFIHSNITWGYLEFYHDLTGGNIMTLLTKINYCDHVLHFRHGGLRGNKLIVDNNLHNLIILLENFINSEYSSDMALEDRFEIIFDDLFNKNTIIVDNGIERLTIKVLNPPKLIIN